MRFVSTQESEVTPPQDRFEGVCSYSNLKKGIKIYQKIENKNENLQLHLIHCKSLEGKKKYELKL